VRYVVCNFFRAQYAFIASDCRLRCSGNRNVAARLAAISGSVFNTLWYWRNGLFGSISFKRLVSLSSSECMGLPTFLADIAARYSGSAHLALIFSRTSGRLAGLASPRKSACTSGDFMRLEILALASGLRAGCLGSSIACRRISRCLGVGE